MHKVMSIPSPEPASLACLHPPLLCLTLKTIINSSLQPNDVRILDLRKFLAMPPYALPLALIFPPTACDAHPAARGQADGGSATPFLACCAENVTNPWAERELVQMLLGLGLRVLWGL